MPHIGIIENGIFTPIEEFIVKFILHVLGCYLVPTFKVIAQKEIVYLCKHN